MAQAAAKKGNSQIKRLLGNKNTVTLLGILICIGTLIGGYNYRINKAIDPTTMPYAKESIPARTLITGKMIGNIRVSSDYANVASNLVKSSEEVIGKYSTYKTAIPAGSLFYKEMLLTAEEMPDAGFANLDDGYTIYSLSVDNETTFDNAVAAGDYIDLYLREDNDKSQEAVEAQTTQQVIFGKFIESIRVLAVKDNAGNNIIKHGYANGQPSELLFAVDEENYLLLYEAEQLNIKIVPILHNLNYTINNNEANTKVSSEFLRSYINEKVFQV